MTTLRWTSQDVELLFPENNGKRYEIVNGELYVSKQPHWHHQHICLRLGGLLDAWCMQTDAGEANAAPGLIFAEDNDVAPDIVWISRERLEAALQPDGRLHAAPELVVEVLSPGITNERRDREAKLRLYARRGVLEYWIVGWQERRIEVYRREDETLELAGTLLENDILQSPLLPGFKCKVNLLFAGIK
jgi:Uma2 family endonuclease